MKGKWMGEDKNGVV